MRVSQVALQAWVLDIVPPGRPVHIVDAGANAGHWSRLFLSLAKSCGRLDDVDLHAFEPCAEAFQQLTTEIGDSAASVRRVAPSDHTGEMILHIGSDATVNSVHDVPGSNNVDEDVAATTLDAYAEQANLDRIDLLGIDTVRHELAVLEGAIGLLREQRIAAVAFQYNQFWIYAGTFLRDAFRLLEPLGYRIGRLTPQGVEFCLAWNPSLENFRGRTYVACAKDMAERLPQTAASNGERCTRSMTADLRGWRRSNPRRADVDDSVVVA